MENIIEVRIILLHNDAKYEQKEFIYLERTRLLLLKWISTLYKIYKMIQDHKGMHYQTQLSPLGTVIVAIRLNKDY